ncbi:MAG: DUF4340 domain-containing protein [Chloroflexi bacterium]|nr:DUF4340 domain-containing protein [Chloroflexota bacterium]
MNRTQQVLAAALAIQILLSVVLFWPKTVTTGSSGPLLPDVKKEDIVAITVTDNEGKSVLLRQVAGNWVLPEADDYPLKAERITQALDKIVGLTTRRLITRTEASYKRLQVAADDFLRRLDLETANGTKYTLFLGSSPSYGNTHVRLDGRSETYLATNLTPWEFSSAPGYWVDTSYFNVPQDQVTKISIQNPKGTFTLEKDADGKWTLSDLAPGEELATETVNLIVTRATSVTMLRPLGKEKRPEYGLDNPVAVVTLQKGEEAITLSIGTQDPTDNSYVVNVSTSPYYVRVGDYMVKPLVENGRENLFPPKATPTPQT